MILLSLIHIDGYKRQVDDRVSAKILDTVRKAGYDFIRYSDIAFGEKDKAVADDILNILLEEKRIVKVSDDLYTLTEYMEKAKTMIQEEFKTVSYTHLYHAHPQMKSGNCL